MGQRTPTKTRVKDIEYNIYYFCEISIWFWPLFREVSVAEVRVVSTRVPARSLAKNFYRHLFDSEHCFLLPLPSILLHGHFYLFLTNRLLIIPRVINVYYKEQNSKLRTQNSELIFSVLFII